MSAIPCHGQVVKIQALFSNHWKGEALAFHNCNLTFSGVAVISFDVLRKLFLDFSLCMCGSCPSERDTRSVGVLVMSVGVGEGGGVVQLEQCSLEERALAGGIAALPSPPPPPHTVQKDGRPVLTIQRRGTTCKDSRRRFIKAINNRASVGRRQSLLEAVLSGAILFIHIYFKRVYTDVTFAIGSEFIRLAADDSAPIADLRGNKKRIPHYIWGDTGATANEHTSEDKVDAKHVYTEVYFVIVSKFNRHALEDSEPIADLQNIGSVYVSREHRVVLAPNLFKMAAMHVQCKCSCAINALALEMHVHRKCTCTGNALAPEMHLYRKSTCAGNVLAPEVHPEQRLHIHASFVLNNEEIFKLALLELHPSIVYKVLQNRALKRAVGVPRYIPTHYTNTDRRIAAQICCHKHKTSGVCARELGPRGALKIQEAKTPPLGSLLVDDRPIMNALKYKVVSGVVGINRTMVSSSTDTNRTGSDMGPEHNAASWEELRLVVRRVTELQRDLKRLKEDCKFAQLQFRNCGTYLLVYERLRCVSSYVLKNDMYCRTPLNPEKFSAEPEHKFVRNERKDVMDERSSCVLFPQTSQKLRIYGLLNRLHISPFSRSLPSATPLTSPDQSEYDMNYYSIRVCALSADPRPERYRASIFNPSLKYSSVEDHSLAHLRVAWLLRTRLVTLTLNCCYWLKESFTSSHKYSQLLRDVSSTHNILEFSLLQKNNTNFVPNSKLARKLLTNPMIARRGATANEHTAEAAEGLRNAMAAARPRRSIKANARELSEDKTTRLNKRLRSCTSPNNPNLRQPFFIRERCTTTSRSLEPVISRAGWLLRQHVIWTQERPPLVTPYLPSQQIQGGERIRRRSDITASGGRPLPPFPSPSFICILEQQLYDNVEVKHVYTEVYFVIVSKFNSHTLDDSEPIADLQVNKYRALSGIHFSALANQSLDASDERLERCTNDRRCNSSDGE
ncbi:hypothetical protein PR048_003629 [Dryococelus australis]|uniref:Uncharacterized protein n=1 Tax=Dryococelus australis TaxID=614101 RepID=A0ABQ9IPV5_9NEOP|nr:hypothetical protein PR048_003629 [Dryococelus australis]